MRLKELEEKYEKLLEELEAQMKELKQNCTEEDCKRWRANVGGKYYCAYSTGCYQDIGQIYCLDSDFLKIAKQEIGEENLRKLFE